ncbi:hypothetical protein LOZ80_13160 [Paenibacillus sp. HWE-109]|uniref:hypothetical protein n=1 Tax=Paenibacillus sp. HWE-109 TaxID=1306526 RepID=UPI001EDD61B4|nr:hypothetical protein [Paenibacillus sp. HWE-109]UKS29822.1 hypothetical protein LOZ80_13160 [Paenibacillus sp. HWE-109]
MLNKRFMVLFILFILIVTGCGNRGIPVIKQDVMDKKVSVLMLSSSSLSDAAKQSIGQALLNWRGEHFIAFDWIKDVNSLDDSVGAKLKANTYDYIYVIGNELIGPANGLIAQGLTTGKWTLLQSQLDSNGSVSTVSDQASTWQIDAQQVENLKSKRIQELLAQRATVEWVTRSDRPIPSVWAPSEEADHIVLLDNNDQWFQQLSFQTKQHFANWVIFYTPVTEAQVQKAKTLGVSVLDISNALSAELNWTEILNNRLAMMTNHGWQKGSFPYNEKELLELKIK